MAKVLVLGSASPRRRTILERLGLAHVVVTPAADEARLAGEAAARYLERVVLLKLEAVRAALPPAVAREAHVVLVADTSVLVDGDVLGKPETEAEGRAMLARLSGRTHEVHTRFAVAEGAAVVHAETVITRVTFRAIEADELDVHARSGEGADKAGGYAVQGRAAGFVSRVDGSHTNVVGLPACEVVLALRAVGIAAR